MANYWSAVWSFASPALYNHLWQTTIFAGMAGLLALALRKNRAQARYWLWLAASVKFLFPFALLVNIGSHFAWRHSSVETKSQLYSAMEEVSQPFMLPASLTISPPNPHAASFPASAHLLSGLFAAAWVAGCMAVFSVWFLRWRRISLAMRAAAPLTHGREVEALRRLERAGGARQKIEMRLSRTSLQPGVFGIARPVLIWPERISARLDDEHLEAILAHEVWHVRRRDNLAAAIHMVVESIFWFHPLVWWLGARLIEERERACDEKVLELGGERKAYAEGILKVCEFCVEAPLACMSGVLGSDLKKRIVRIMSGHAAVKLDFSRKLLLGVAGVAVIAVPVMAGLVSAARSQQVFDMTANLPQPVSLSSNGSALLKTGDSDEPQAHFKTGDSDDPQTHSSRSHNVRHSCPRAAARARAAELRRSSGQP
jgi:beta-lactamase regulating signal transducer with metallopeptidase domain